MTTSANDQRHKHMTGGAFLRRVRIVACKAAAASMRSIIKLNFPVVCLYKRKDGCGKGFEEAGATGNR